MIGARGGAVGEGVQRKQGSTAEWIIGSTQRLRC